MNVKTDVTRSPRLGVNIDHVATIRNARGGDHPDPVRAAHIAAKAGADGITTHLREDRRHITDLDIERLSAEIDIPLNLEMAATDEMLKIALKYHPNAACIVPENREERTTEGGLNVIEGFSHLKPIIRALTHEGIRVSLFIEPSVQQIDATIELGATVVEFHTGAYCMLTGERQSRELVRIQNAAKYAKKLELEVHAGHGLGFINVAAIAKIPEVIELNIGHFLMGEAMFSGLEKSIKKMHFLIRNARQVISQSKIA